MKKLAVVWMVFVLLGLVLAGSSLNASAALPETPFERRPAKIYYVQSADLEALKKAFVNINLHMRKKGRSDAVDYQVVIHGPTVQLFRTDGIDPELQYMVDWFLDQGILVGLCGKCAEQYGVVPESVVPGVLLLKSAGKPVSFSVP